MSDLNLRQNLSLAWLRRAETAANDLNRAMEAPALFTPEFVAKRQREYAEAMAWARFWDSQAVAA